MPTPPPDACIDTTAGLAYWNGIPASEDGMLGGVPSLPGFSLLSKVDLQGSRAFLAKLGFSARPTPGSGTRRAGACLEGGAGIGRITRGLLVDVADAVDVVEPVAKFTAGLEGTARRVWNCGLEGWRAEEGSEGYDVVWTQWCVGHLTDRELVEYLGRCREVLREGGVVVVKENLSTGGRDEFDEEDSSVTRTDEKFKILFEEAGFNIVRQELQKGFPITASMSLLPVKMYGLKPKTANKPRDG